MDPLSIATAVVGLTATCLSTCKKLHDLAGDYGDVPVIIAAICSESTIIGIGLSELQTKILQRDDLSQAWASRTEIWAAFEMALTGCMAVFSCLEAETRHLQSKNSGVWAKIKFMWNQERLKELLAQLRGQQTSITFLLKLLEMDTLSSIQNDIRQNARKMQDTAAEAQSLRSRTPSIKLPLQSIFDNDTSRLSFFEFEIISGIAPSELDFEFDDVVVNSKVYRRELHKAKAKNQRISAPETADEDPDPDTFTLRGNNPRVEVARTETQRLTLDSPSVDIAEGLPIEIVDLISETEKSLHKGKEKQPVSQSGNISADNLSSVEVCCICDGYPQQAVILSQQQPYHLHEGRRYCHLHFCRYRTDRCHACQFPIMTPSPGPMHNRICQKFHPACYGIISNWDIYIPVSFEGRQYINSVENDWFYESIDTGIQKQHDAYLERIYQVGSQFLSDFENSLSDALQYRATGKDRKAAFELWKTMLDSALRLFRLSERLLTPEAAHAGFVKFAKRFCQSLAQPVSGHEISAPIIARDTTAMLGSIFKANLEVLLKQSSEDASWDKYNEELDVFLTRLSVTKSSRFPFVWATEPTDGDEQSLICKECHQFLGSDDGTGMYMRGLIFDISSTHDRWHPDCVPCRLCNKSTSIRSHAGNVGSFKCEQESCGFESQFLFIPHYYQIVCGMWLSWSIVA